MTTNLFKVSALALVAGILITSCNKSQNDEAASNAMMRVVAEDATTCDNTAQAIDENADDDMVAYRNPGTTAIPPASACATVTSTMPLGTFPNTVTIDYGSGCVDARGRTRSGQLIVNITGPWSVAGSVRTITFNNFFINDVQVTGTRTLTSNGPDANGCLSFTRTANITLTYSDGTSRTWNATRTRTQIAGCGTATNDDDVWSITGSGSGVNRNGVAYSATIQTPLVKAHSCQWFESGVVEIISGAHTRTIDYGNGNCDDQATVSINGGSPIAFTLRH